MDVRPIRKKEEMIERAIRNTPGVEKVLVDLIPGSGVCVYLELAHIWLDDLERLIEMAERTVREMGFPCFERVRIAPLDSRTLLVCMDFEEKKEEGEDEWNEES